MLGRIALSLGIVGALAAPITARAQALVADWTFGDASNLGLDSSGYANNATTVSGVTQVPGPTAGTYAGAFAGTSSMFDVIGGLTGQTGVAGVTYSAWVMVTGQNPDFNAVINQDYDNCCVQRLLLDGGTTAFINAGAHADQLADNATAPLNTWFNIALTEQVTGPSSLTASVYINGVSEDTFDESFGINSFSGINTYLGAQYVGSGQYYGLIGDLSDVRVYDGALSSDQVSALYASGADSAGSGGSSIPEPASFMVLGTGLLTLGAIRARRSSRA